MLDISILDDVKNETVFKALLKANNIISKFKKILVSVSGGSDSDIVMDIVEKVKSKDQIIDYVFFDTGIEYQATKNHLDYLEQKYGVNIKRVKAIKSIPISCREHGQPFLSKYVSEQIGALQRFDFKFEDKPYEELIKEYPKCKSRLKWWCNEYKARWLSIGNFKYLKEFLVLNPPKFKISSKCCTYAKKKPAKTMFFDNGYDLNVLGLRKAEGGIRQFANKTCFSEHANGGVTTFLPIFWFLNDDKKYYNEYFKIVNSDCYTKYGLSRTGCVGCPFERNIDKELSAALHYEPNLYKACNKIFKDSYEYTEQFKEFKEQWVK